jgi:hypothetical protein
MRSDFALGSLDSIGASKSLESLTFVSSTSETAILLDAESKTVTSAKSVELINLNTGNKEEFVLKIPSIYDRIILQFKNFRDLQSLKCILKSAKASSSFSINAPEIKLPLDNNYTGLIKLSILGHDKEILCFTFYRELLVLSSSQVVNTRDSKTLYSFQNGDSQFNLPENPFPIPMADGPLFRETVNYYEQLAPLVLKKLQNTMEKMNSLDQNLKGLESSKLQMLETLKDFKKGFLPSLSKSDLVYSKFEILETKPSMEHDLTYQFLCALRQSTAGTKIDFTVLKSLQNFNSIKKNFEDESKKFYDWLSKLMSSGKSKDEKLLNKMINFEVVQMEYFNYLYDSVTPMLLALVHPASKPNKEYWRNRPLREQAIRKIRDCNKFDEFSKLMQKYSKATVAESTLLLIDPNSLYNVDTTSSPLKTGLLFVYGGQGKSGWHKQWLVLCNGKLYEYMDWRKGAELRNTPLDISLCNIKLLDANEHKNNIDIGSRKNCFRVINSQGIEHVFQAFTQEDANDWVKALIESGQKMTFNRSSTQKSNITTGSDLKNNQNRRNNENMDMVNVISRENTIKLTKPRVRRVSSVSLSLLHIVQRIDPSNCTCADCGSTDQVEWVSINLLVVFCIQCSSAHRALGTSVSKVRSLMLDSFVGEHRVLVCHINNAFVNSIYEARVPINHKPTATSNHETRLEFITEKYLKKSYIDDRIKLNASKALLEGVKNDNVQKVLEAIAGGANVNKKFIQNNNTTGSSAASILSKKSDSDSRSEITFLEYALLHPSILDDREVFDIAELLVLNGCDAGTQVRAGTLLNEKAKKWWQSRIDKINGNCSNQPKKPSQKILTQNNIINQLKQPSINPNVPRTSISGNRPSLSLTATHRKLSPSSKSRLKSPKEGFNLFKKKIKNLE